jgi:hypothetical protein
VSVWSEWSAEGDLCKKDIGKTNARLDRDDASRPILVLERIYSLGLSSTTSLLPESIDRYIERAFPQTELVRIDGRIKDQP